MNDTYTMYNVLQADHFLIGLSIADGKKIQLQLVRTVIMCNVLPRIHTEPLLPPHGPIEEQIITFHYCHTGQLFLVYTTEELVRIGASTWFQKPCPIKSQASRFWVGGKQGSLVRASKGTFVKIRVDWQIKLFKTEDYLVILTTHSPKWHWRDLLLREEVSHR